MAHSDLDRLYDYCVKFSREILAKEGELAPFAAAIKAGGQLVPVIAGTKEEQASAEVIVATLTSGLCTPATQHQTKAAAFALMAGFR